MRITVVVPEEADEEAAWQYGIEERKVPHGNSLRAPPTSASGPAHALRRVGYPSILSLGPHSASAARRSTSGVAAHGALVVDAFYASDGCPDSAKPDKG
jgi:hypothetical protein